VGDRFNYEPVLLRAGRVIAYPTNGGQARDDPRRTTTMTATTATATAPEAG